MANLRKNETVTFRMDSATHEMIQRAAGIAGKSVTAFVTEAATTAAQRELLDRRFVGVDAAVFDGIEALLSQPAKVNSQLVSLFKSSVEWID